MPIDQTLRGLALEINASTDPSPEAQPLLEYRFIDTASTQTILARIKGLPISTGGGKLAFETSSGAKPTTPRMLIDHQGNVGIGTENPGARLEVGGDAKFNGPLDIQGALTVKGTAVIGGDLTVSGKLTARSFAGDAAELSNVTPADGSVTNAKLAQDSGSLSKVTGGSMMVSGENVGIGSQNPVSKLHIRSSASDLLPPRLEASAAASFAAGWDFYHETTPKGYVGVPGSTAGIAPGEMLLFGAAETKLSLWAGGNRSLTVDTNGNVGIGTANPTHRFHVLAPDAVGLFESTGTQAYLRLSTREGLDNRVEITNRPGGRLSLWTAVGGDVFNITKTGLTGIGTINPTHRFHVLAPDAVGLFESSGTQAYLRLSTREGFDNRVEITNRPGGRLSLWTAAGGDVVNITRRGLVGIGTIAPQFTLDVAGLAHASSFPTSSDARLKTNVAKVSGVLEKLKNVRAVFFEWNEHYKSLGRSTGKREVGVVAQEIEAVFPELVTEWGDKKYKAIDYGRLAAVLLEAVKELAAHSEILSQQVRGLQKAAHPIRQAASNDPLSETMPDCNSALQ